MSVCGVHTHLALAEGALSAVFEPGGATEARDPVFVLAGLGDVVADAVSLARVRHAVSTALTLRHQREVTVRHWAGQWPAVHLSLL